MTPTTPTRTSWRTHGAVRFWVNSFLAAPVALFFASIVSGIAGGSLGVFLRLIFGDDPRLQGTLLHAPTDTLAIYGIIAAVSVTLASVLAWWVAQSPVSFSLDDDRIVRWGLTGRKTIYWRNVVHAFVTTPQRGNVGAQTLHLWTPWRELSIPAHHITNPNDLTDDRNAQLEEFLHTVEQHLQTHGKHLERDIPTTSITNTRSALRYLLFWPHRRRLAQRARNLQTQTPSTPIDHTQPRLSLALGWLFRPTPILFATSLLSLSIFIHHATSHPLIPTIVAWGGVLFAALVPFWNWSKEALLKLRGQGDWMPETSIGQHTLKGPLPDRLLPAPSCLIDFRAMSVQRPDGTHFAFEDIQAVEYGPAKTPHTKPSPSQAWHLALYTHKDPQTPLEIFGNASADIVRHGDLDSGYAAFNWIAAREVALRSEAHLILAHGRVAHTHVGTTLEQRLRKDITRYDPTPMRDALEASGEEPRVFIHSTPDEFRAWGPLTRQPEHCATLPLWKATAALLCLPLITLGYTPFGLILGYLLALCVYDTITYTHFKAPGFRMDRSGVWVRGVCIPWDDLEASSLMPVAPGPILFAGARTVLIAGHLGSSYNERAWLGCAAYHWIRTNVCEHDDFPNA